MQIRSVILGNDPKQATRIERLLLGSSTYVIGMLIISYCTWRGLLPSAAYWVMAGAIVVNLGFYLLIRFNWNLLAKDPSLTVPQMLVGSLVTTYLVYHANEVRGAFLMGYVLILVFGIFKLRPRQFLQLGAIVIAAYGAIIWMQYSNGTRRLNLPLELLQWLMLVLIYPWFAWVGGYLSDMRRRQRETNIRLEKALSENSAALQIIQEQATHDELTGLYNRRYIMDELQRQKGLAARTGQPFCILLIDVDHFKKINDSAGHLVGDKVLAACANEIKTALRSTDRLARWGGEEFMVVMPAVTLESSQDIVRRILDCVGQRDFSALGIPFSITISIGVAQWRPGESLEDILNGADYALYLAKANGRNRSQLRA